MPIIANCDFVGTDPSYGYAVWNQTTTNTVTAKNCWWNSNTGPNHASNPGGMGERVSDYVIFDPWATQLAKPVLGDVSMNGEVTPYDASLVLRHSAGNIVLTAKQQTVADVNSNGMITAYDAALILEYSVGLISRFEPEPLGTKAAIINDLATISFPILISEPAKKTFSIPLTVSTTKGIKALDMKYSINPDHVKFLRINQNNLPVGISIEAGYNSQKKEVGISMASAYYLELINQQFILEFEFVDSGITESKFSLTMALANDNFLTEFPGDATISNKSTITGFGDISQGSEPIVYTSPNGIHAQVNLSNANQDLFIQVFDLTGRTLFKSTVRNMSQGMQYIDLSYSDFENPGRGICILNLRTDSFSFSKKLLIK